MDALLDTATLAELHGILGPDLLGIIQLFAQQAAEESATLAQCIQNQDAGGVARHAHALKGSSGNLGAAALSSSAAAIEAAAKAGDMASASRMVASLPAVVHETLAAMRASGYLKG